MAATLAAMRLWHLHYDIIQSPALHTGDKMASYALRMAYAEMKWQNGGGLLVACSIKINYLINLLTGNV